MLKEQMTKIILIISITRKGYHQQSELDGHNGFILLVCTQWTTDAENTLFIP